MDFLHAHSGQITTFLLGGLGAAVRIAIGHDKGEKQSKSKIAATFISGTVLAGTTNEALTNYVGLPNGFSGGVSFVIGLLAIGFVYQALDGKFQIIKGGGKK